MKDDQPPAASPNMGSPDGDPVEVDPPAAEFSMEPDPGPLGAAPAGQEAVPRYAFAHLRHELRTPLNQIIGYSDLLLEEAHARGEESTIHDLERIRTAGECVLQRINEILDLSRLRYEADPTPCEEPPSVPAHTSKAPAPGSATVLVVEDEEANRDMLCRRLERQGFSVIAAADGHSALATLADWDCDLVLLDIMMPGMNGFETLARMKADANLRHIPVIVISALDDLDSVVRCIEMGAEDYLPKPFNPVILRARIGASLEKKRLRDQEHHLYTELQENYNRLRDLERLRDDLTHMIVHDLRQPMTAFLSGLRLVEAVGPLNDHQTECLGVAASGGEMLISMVNDLLDVGKMEAGALVLMHQDVPVTHLFEEAMSHVMWLARDKCQNLDHKVQPGVTSVRGDEEKLRRALVNLMGNAVKFTPEGGTITLSARRDGDEMVLSVSDTGDGIPAEAFERIFEKFGQVEMRKEGKMLSTGLGLTFCKMVAESHGGRIWVESEPGRGSIFSIALPVS